jgi:hypothetical protein
MTLSNEIKNLSIPRDHLSWIPDSIHVFDVSRVLIPLALYGASVFFPTEVRFPRVL